jgi:hypothetical protein
VIRAQDPQICGPVRWNPESARGNWLAGRKTLLVQRLGQGPRPTPQGSEANHLGRGCRRVGEALRLARAGRV